MNSFILQTISRLLLGWMLLFSWWILLRGHHAPGGGFIGGLIAAAALSIHLLAYGNDRLYTLIRLSPLTWLCVGLVLILLSSLWGLFAGRAWFTSIWSTLFPTWVNSPLLFDTGIYLIVCFSVVTMLTSLEHSK